MKLGAFRKFLLLVFFCAFAFCAVLMYLSLRGIMQENEKMASNDATLQSEIERLEREKAYKEEYYFRMIHDENFAARVIRERMGYSSPKEIVFRFEDSKPVSVNEGIHGERRAMSETERAAIEEEERIIRAARKARIATGQAIAAEVGDPALEATGNAPVPETPKHEPQEQLLSTPLTFAPRQDSTSASQQESSSSAAQTSTPSSQSPRVDKRVNRRVDSSTRPSSSNGDSDNHYRSPDKPDGSGSKKRSEDIEKAIRISERKR